MKNIPLRKCLITKKMLPKEELFRVVKTKDNKVLFDDNEKLNGRGAYLSRSKEVIEKAKRINIFQRVFSIEVDPSIYDELLKKCKGDR